MKRKAGPAVIAVAVVVMIVFLAVMYRVFFPPSQPSDTDNPKGMPSYARDFLKNKKAGGHAPTAADFQRQGSAPGSH